MFKKNDPLVESVKKIMEHNELCRRVEARLCEELGIASRKALPFEHHANYDALLEQRIAEEGSHPRNEKEARLAAMKHPKNKITHADVLKGRGVIDETSSSDPDMAAPADPRAPKYKDEIKYKEEPKTEMPKNPPMPPKRPANLEEKAVSKAQQKFMAMVLAKKRGEMKDASPEVEKAAESMSTKSARDFAKTKHKGLPEKKDQTND